MAPGTTVMAFSRERARRSTFWLVTYSSDCQRVTSRSRVPTFTLPATEPMVGSWKKATILDRASGASCVSASTPTTTGASLISRARLRALALPPLGLRRTVTRGSRPKRRATTSPVPSAEPSSTTITRTSTPLEARSEPTVRSITSASL